VSNRACQEIGKSGAKAIFTHEQLDRNELMRTQAGLVVASPRMTHDLTNQNVQILK
jgi:hypothetical protein